MIRGKMNTKRTVPFVFILGWAMQLWAVVSAEQVVYDHYFDAATFALAAEASGDTVAYRLLITYDEGRIDVPAGSALTLHLRDRSTIRLATVRDLGRADVMVRRWRDHTSYYVTCHYALTRSQLARMLEKDVYRLEIETAQGVIVRPVRRFQSKLAAAVAAVSGAV